MGGARRARPPLDPPMEFEAYFEMLYTHLGYKAISEL